MPPGNSSEAQAALPAAAFSRLLAECDDLDELKVSLFCLAALAQKEGAYRSLRQQEFADDEDLMRGLARGRGSPAAEAALESALNKAAARGSLLRAALTRGGKTVCYYFADDASGRALHAQALAGQWLPAADEEIAILPPRPSIFALYEENIGPLTPMIADTLKAAAADYPQEWLEAAMQIAVERNARHWRYISKVLERWRQEGRSHETRGRDLAGAEHYTSGEWQRHIET